MRRAAEANEKANALLCAAAVVVLAVIMFPIYWMAVTSFKTEIEIFRVPPTLFPKVLNTDSYAAQLRHGDFNMFGSFRNSFVISFAAMIISLLLAIPASYGIARFQFKGKRFFILSFLITQMLPVSVILTPMFIIFRDLHLLNKHVSAILADATIGIPFSILVLQSFFSSIPKELEDAARMDGCNRFLSFLLVFVPIAFPGIIVCAVFSFLYGWGDLAYGMTFLQDQAMRPITAGMFNFLGQYGTKWSYLTAFAVVTILPVTLIFLFMQKYIISGLTSGAVKG
ncbi:MAG TPA: carbohydrate ABC transporter permease [Treponema sp.]|nr:MAG: ABC transporter permease [Treponema sp. GWA1_62_8]OHE69790.1 MAG: ABC transporter permease [Treponema sp. GWC1_61_84]HCM26345.1 carbohydrate ABC transporter permease [Treponema sp.]